MDDNSKNRANPFGAQLDELIKQRNTPLTPNQKRATAAALSHDPLVSELPKLIAAGRGKWAEQILKVAFERGIKVREDAPLAEMLAAIELDSPIPAEAIMAVAEILAYVYAAEGQKPFE